MVCIRHQKREKFVEEAMMNFVCLSGIAKEDAWVRKNDKGLLIASFTLLVDVEKQGFV